MGEIINQIVTFNFLVLCCSIAILTEWIKYFIKPALGSHPSTAPYRKGILYSVAVLLGGCLAAYSGLVPTALSSTLDRLLYGVMAGGLSGLIYAWVERFFPKKA